MKNKLLVSTLLLLALAVILCSQAFATNMMQSAGNTIMNAGNAIGNAAAQTGNTIVNGTRNLTNDAATLGNDAMNGIDDAVYGNGATLGTPNNYTATRTATDNAGLFGMSTTMSTWLILGIVGAIIVGLIWYYGAQYEHRDYTND